MHVVKLLLQFGANAEARDRWGNRPIDDAVREGSERARQVLETHMEAGTQSWFKSMTPDGLRQLAA